ncbi:MAG: ATP-binding protein [Deltaproteobacteria bacterium]|nr:ATP-binding protein [Deltaproteobacteria bacterium]
MSKLEVPKNPKQIFQSLLVLVVSILLGMAHFQNWAQFIFFQTQAYLLIPFLIWVVFQFGQREALLAVFAISILAIWGTVHGMGPFAMKNQTDALILLQGFIAVTSLIVLFLGAVLAERARAKEMIKEHVEDLESFTYSVSHDLRAPLRHIHTHADQLKQKASPALTAEERECIEIISQSVVKMGKLLDDLLDLSKVGRVEIQKTKIDLNALVRETLEMFREETKGRKIQWKIGSLPYVWGDAKLLKLVLTNLISNTLKFTKPRSVAMIEIGWHDSGGNDIILFIKDNGVGFDKNLVGKLFKVFQRLHAPDQFEGTGVGLFNVQKIIGRHGGRIWAEGAIDQGATFYWTLPVKEG